MTQPSASMEPASSDADDVLHAARAWLRAGKRVALATVVSTWGSSPRPAGSQLAVREDVAFVGSVFAATLLKVRSRDVLLPVILYPLLIPVFVAGTKTTAALVGETPNLEEAWFWIQFLGIYDAVFLVLSLWTFESLVIE